MSRPLSSKYSVELGFSFDEWVGDNCTLWRNAVINQDMDCMILIDGKVGSGKSVWGMLLATFFDIERKLDVETQICFTPDELKKAINTLPKYKSVIYDEAMRGLNRRRATEKETVELVELFAECRQNNLFLIVILPSFYDLDMTQAVWRSKILCHIYYKWKPQDSEKNRKYPLWRGFGTFYNENAKLQMYSNKAWRQQYYYPNLKECFTFRFPNHYVVDEARYRERKREAIKRYSEKDKEKKASLCPECNGKIHYKTKKGFKCHKGHYWGNTHTNQDIRKKAEA